MRPGRSRAVRKEFSTKRRAADSPCWASRGRSWRGPYDRGTFAGAKQGVGGVGYVGLCDAARGRGEGYKASGGFGRTCCADRSAFCRGRPPASPRRAANQSLRGDPPQGVRSPSQLVERSSSYFLGVWAATAPSKAACASLTASTYPFGSMNAASPSVCIRFTFERRSK
jgi:hypothetical protein